MTVGLISLAGYLPAKPVPQAKKTSLVAYLRSNTRLPEAYIQDIERTGQLPGKIETNEEGWSDQPWFSTWLQRLPEKKHQAPFQGAVERRRVPLDPTSLRGSIIPHPMLPSDAETLAGAMALHKAGISKDEIDLVLVSSQVPDMALPCNASLVQDKLQLTNAGAYGMDTCCSSFVTMLQVATALVKSGIKRKVLVIASYIDSHVTDRSDYFSVNTGDASVAGIVTLTEDGAGYLGSHSLSDGSRHQGIIFEDRSPGLFMRKEGGATLRKNYTTFKDQDICKEIAAHAQEDLSRVVFKTLEIAGMEVADVDFLVTHQPVAWAPEAWRSAIGVAKEKFFDTFTTYGNIANCSAPVNLLEALERGFVKAGDKVMMASSGAGENQIAVFMTVPRTLAENCQL
jgi:3-oxoacyl-[acyl-carrier-protein] synthase-3